MKYFIGKWQEIQQLPRMSPNPAVLSMLGWRDLTTHVHLTKLMFVHRILSLASSSLYRRLFIQRFYQVLLSGIYCSFSPVAQIILLSMKYNVLVNILNVIEEGILPQKREWKKMCRTAVDSYCYSKWRFELQLYSKLSVFRTVVLRIEPCVRWQMAKECVYLKPQCVTMVKLLCRTNALYANVQIAERTCQICNNGIASLKIELLH